MGALKAAIKAGKVHACKQCQPYLRMRSTTPDPASELLEYFKKADLPKEPIHILVQLPPSESIDSMDPRVRCVAETSPISSTTPSSAIPITDESESDERVDRSEGLWCRVRVHAHSTANNALARAGFKLPKPSNYGQNSPVQFTASFSSSQRKSTPSNQETSSSSTPVSC